MRIPYNPFEDLKDFIDFPGLINHIIKSLEVTKIKVLIPPNFDVCLIHNPDTLVPVGNLLVGDATFEYIFHRSGDILREVKERIRKITDNRDLSYQDRVSLYKESRKNLLRAYQYFNSMNPLRYMTSFDWFLIYETEENGKIVTNEVEYVNSKIGLTNDHWNLLENTLLIRRHMLSEVLYLTDVELGTLYQELAETRYEWKGKTQYELYELLTALIASNRINYVKGDEKTFIHDFMKFFSLSDKKYSYFKNKILERKERQLFLNELSETLALFGKPTYKKAK